MENEKIETWFAELYRLSMMGKLSINELYAEFKKAINGTQNKGDGKIHPYFYSHEWAWGEELDGCYYRAIDVEQQLAQLQKKLDCAVKALEKLGKTGDGSHKDKHASFFDCLPTLQIEFEERINFARLALEEIRK